jgi:hypothetical protein
MTDRNIPALNYNGEINLADEAIHNLLVDVRHDMRNSSKADRDEFVAATLAKSFSAADLEGTGKFSPVLNKYFGGTAVLAAALETVSKSV